MINELSRRNFLRAGTGISALISANWPALLSPQSTRTVRAAKPPRNLHAEQASQPSPGISPTDELPEHAKPASCISSIGTRHFAAETKDVSRRPSRVAGESD
jgi:hypothetical protein